MRTLKLVVEYDGAGYCGWQRQRGSAAGGPPSVQATLERAVAEVAGEPVTVTGAGRTDAGVHALGQVASLVTTSRIPAARFPAALNAHLPPDVRAVAAEDVPEGFHARYDAVARTYWYEILNRPGPPALLRGLAHHIPEPLDVEAMRRAAAPLVGRHDFVAYRGVGSPTRTTVCRVEALTVGTADGGAPAAGPEARLRIAITADRFLRHMVRIIAGTLVRVGLGRLPAEAPEAFLADPDNRRTGPTAPPHGLYLVRIDY
ncbi:MAG TPA: tRNA pseudouridine(38-40) synthase TruA [bacterium]|nr:tRNA pseudouridine(38-40) synthase TruA [bacterium]